MDIKRDFVIRPEKGSRQPWIVKVSEIPSQGVDFDFNSQKGQLNSVLEDLLGPKPEYDAHVSLKANDKMIILDAALSGTMPLTCSRCAEDYSMPIQKKSTIAYYRSEDDQVRALGDDLTDIQGSFDLEFLDSNEIDVSEVIHEQMALEIPFQPLCKEDCQGLCTYCGIDLNKSQKCNCKKEVELVLPLQAALKNIKHLRS